MPIISDQRPESSCALTKKGRDAAGVPTLYVQKDDKDGRGFELIRKVMGHTHKHHRDDAVRIVRTCDHINTHIDLDAVIA